LIKVQLEDFHVDELIEKIRTRDSGCIVTFIGTVRDYSGSKNVSKMSLEVYEEMALNELEKISEEAKELFALNCVNIVHRHGELSVGENIVFIGVSAGHRDQGFEGCRFIIDELKKRVPIWKKEFTPEGEFWVEGEY
jgi:molybdopterin synthase catalytic subunit